MDVSRKQILYRKGQDIALDTKFLKYRGMRIWAGGAVNQALTKNEIDTLVKLWRKEKLSPHKLYVEDVQKLVEFSEIIRSCRRRIKREMSRRRMEKARAKTRKDCIC